MKLLIHAHAYPTFLQEIYGARPELESADYDTQFAVFDRESHVGGNAAWAEALRPLGYDAKVTISNNERLQKTWAQEHGARYELTSWKTEIAEAQIESFGPDVVLFTNYLDLPPGWIGSLRENHAGVRVFGIWCGMPFGSVDVFKDFDLVLTCAPELDERFRSAGCRSRQLHHAFDRRVLDRIDMHHERDIPFSFVGQLIRGRAFHDSRIRELERIADTVEIAIYSPAHERYGAQRPRRAARAGSRVAHALSRGRVRLKPDVSEKLQPYTRPAVFGLAMYQTLQRSRVTYNSHGDVAARSASNRRLFEATGVGTCLLTDHKDDIATLFEPDREVVTYSTTDECIDKVKWLLDHPSERLLIAEAGQRRTLADHTYAHRAAELDSVIRESLAGAGATGGRR